MKNDQEEKLFVAVYRIHCIVTNMNYIGISINPEGRISAHANSPYPIGRAIRKYGWENFEVDILYLAKTRKEACKLEIKEIAKYNCQAPNGYNLTEGGDNPPRRCGKDNVMSNPKHRAKAIAGIKKYHKEHPGIRKGENAGMYGKHHSKETKMKQSKAKLGKKQPNISKALKISNARPETKAKRSAAKKGCKNPAVSESNRRRKGKKFSENHLKNLRIAREKRRLRELEK